MVARDTTVQIILPNRHHRIMILYTNSYSVHTSSITMNKHTSWQRMIHRWQARRDIPFRKRFFVGYDLNGNTYWEFTPDGNMDRLRRKMEPVEKEIFEADYFEKIPPQWLQWLRRTRYEPPTLEELVEDKNRQERIKILALQADLKWTQKKQELEHIHQTKLQRELDKLKLEEEQKQSKSNTTTKDNDPWKAAEKKDNPIEEATILSSKR